MQPFQAPSTIHPPQGEVGPYLPEEGIFDEMMFPDGTVRPHWRTFADFLSHCTPADLTSRADTVQRLLNDHGVTYNVYDDALGTSRPWSLDLVPFLVSSQDFNKITPGLNQRARLLNAILEDIYGQQRLLREGLLPPQIVYANPAFLRPVCGINPPGGRFLTLYACDIARGANGDWLALMDRTQSPSAHGYALENRMILSHVFQEEFHTSHVCRLADYFDQMRDGMRALSPQGRRGNAGILMFTPGPKHETYFEHAFKARYLGFPLAEGADLTVRDRRLWLKTLEGLKRVDVLLRHVDDIHSDPLELRGDADLGVAGLTEAWRSGSVALVNGLGSGLVETPALHPFLPGICRALFDEDLIIPSVPTWWCGQPRELAFVLESPTRWVLKPAFQQGARDPIFLNQLSQKDCEQVLDRLRAAPHEWVAQEVLQLSTTPTFTQGKIQPRSLVWRTLAMANGPDTYDFLPGGLARVSPEPHRWVVTMRSGGVSKDTWVVADDAISAQDVTPKTPSLIRPARPPSAVPSRAADHLFWLGRYAERLEQTVRILRTAIHCLSGERSSFRSREAKACLHLMSAAGLIPEGAAVLTEQLPSLLRDGKRAGSIPDLLLRIRFNAAASRDRLSDDTWRLLNRLERDARLPAGSFAVQSAQEMLDTLVLDLAAFSGMHLENVTRGHGWRFLEMGRRIERASVSLELVRGSAALATEDESALTTLLEVFDSSMTYRRLHYSRPQLAPTLDLLLLEDSNPRSVAFQLQSIAMLVRHLPEDLNPASNGLELAQMDTLQSHLAAFKINPPAHQTDLLLSNLETLSETLMAGLEKLSETITERFFSHATRRVR